MAGYMVIRTVEMDQERAQQAAAWLKQTEELRRQHGMRLQLLAQKVIDPRTYLLVQVWESEAVYRAWQRSETRSRLVQEAPRDYRHASTFFYQVL